MNKKSGKSAKEVSSYEIRDIVLGKVRGYPPWPGMVSSIESRVPSGMVSLISHFISPAFRFFQVVDPENVPEQVMKERPTTKKTHFYCVRFFPTGDLSVISLFLDIHCVLTKNFH